ncbi:MAG: N-acetylmuramoyl-L-alanine amidase [Bacteroidota bacterium]
MTPRSLVCFCVGLLFGLSAYGQSPAYLSVVAKGGDGVYALLNRFQLRTACNEAEFYRINQLRKKQGLKEGRTYFLPVYVYSYNGKSIRSTTGKDDRPWAEQVQAYNEAMYQLGLKSGDYRQNQELWVAHHQLHCPEEMQAASSVVETEAPVGNSGTLPLRGTYSILGPEYAKVPLMSTTLNGCVYYVVGGHGGPDPGAVGKYGRHQLCEDEYAYDVALRLTRNLLANGATVYLITRDQNDGIRSGEILPCDKDERCWGDLAIPAGQSERLTQRSDAVNFLYQKNRSQGVRYQRMVVIHIDSNSKRERVDTYFYHKASDSRGYRFAYNLKETLRAKYAEVRQGRGYNGTVNSRDLHMLRETEPTTAFIELGNIRNPNDQIRLVKERNRQLLADWLFEGMVVDARNP